MVPSIDPQPSCSDSDKQILPQACASNVICSYTKGRPRHDELLLPQLQDGTVREVTPLNVAKNLVRVASVNAASAITVIFSSAAEQPVGIPADGLCLVGIHPPSFPPLSGIRRAPGKRHPRFSWCAETRVGAIKLERCGLTRRPPHGSDPSSTQHAPIFAKLNFGIPNYR